jgi:hypothetical protein
MTGTHFLSPSHIYKILWLPLMHKQPLMQMLDYKSKVTGKYIRTSLFHQWFDDFFYE